MTASLLLAMGPDNQGRPQPACEGEAPTESRKRDPVNNIGDDNTVELADTSIHAIHAKGRI